MDYCNLAFNSYPAYGTYPMYTYTYYPDNNAQVIAQLLKRIADLEAKLDGHKK